MDRSRSELELVMLALPRTLLLCLTLLAGGCAGPPAQSPAVVVTSLSDRGMIGSGVPVGENRLLTAAHVLPKAHGRIKVSNLETSYWTVARGETSVRSERRECRVSELAGSLEGDWALIELIGISLEGEPSHFGPPPTPGDRVLLDAASGGGPVYLQGTVVPQSEVRSASLSPRLIVIRPDDEKLSDLDGASGGRVLNSRGQVVGIFIATVEAASRYRWIVRQTEDIVN